MTRIVQFWSFDPIRHQPLLASLPNFTDRYSSSNSPILFSIVTDHMMLCAASLGLDTLWICMFKPEAVRAEFNLPEHVEPVNILLVGYGACIPADPGRHELLRKPLSETVVEERF